MIAPYIDAMTTASVSATIAPFDAMVASIVGIKLIIQKIKNTQLHNSFSVRVAQFFSLTGY